MWYSTRVLFVRNTACARSNLPATPRSNPTTPRLGSVIADSVEHFDKRAFCDAAPQMMYDFGKSYSVAPSLLHDKILLILLLRCASTRLFTRSLTYLLTQPRPLPLPTS